MKLECDSIECIDIKIAYADFLRLSKSPQKPESDQLKELPLPDRRPILLVETTGSKWNDLWLAVKTQKLEDYTLDSLGRVPCNKTGLLSGFAAGVGMGLIRGISGGWFLGRIWGTLSFTFVAVGSWQICRHRYYEERNKMYRVVPKLISKKNEEGTTATTDQASRKSSTTQIKAAQPTNGENLHMRS